METQTFHGTTILAMRRDNTVVVAGDGQVTLGNTVMKGNATKVRKIYGDKVIVGFAGATADAFTLLERFEAMLERHGGQLKRAAVELAKDWRTDRRRTAGRTPPDDSTNARIDPADLPSRRPIDRFDSPACRRSHTSARSASVNTATTTSSTRDNASHQQCCVHPQRPQPIWAGGIAR